MHGLTSGGGARRMSGLLASMNGFSEWPGWLVLTDGLMAWLDKRF